MIGTLMRRLAGKGGGGGEVARTTGLPFTAETTPAADPAGFTAEHIP